MRVLVLTDSPSVSELLGYATNGSALVLPAEPLPLSPDALFRALGGAPPPHVVVLHPSEPNLTEALTFAQALDQQAGVGVVLVSGRTDVAYEALRAGVRDVLPPDADVATLRRSLDHAGALPMSREGSSQVSAAAARPSGRVITVASPKGGVGKTTVSTNIAVGLAARFPQAVVIVDLDIHFGDVASALNLNPEYTLPDTVRGPAASDPLALKSLLAQHESGLFVVAGSDSPVAADAVTARDVHRLLEMLASEFAFVVVDTAPGLSEHTLTVLDQSSELVLVTSLDVPGVRGLRKEIETLRELGMLLEHRHVVLNFTEDSRGLSVKDVEATIGEDVDIVVPQSKIVPLSTNQGIPLVQSNGKDPVTKQLIALIDRIAGPPPVVKRGLFGRRQA